jgi:uncharacterized membrane protein
MQRLLLAGILDNDLWYALPLVIAVSLVYAATRHEAMEPILRHAVRVGTWIVGFMAVVFVLLLLGMWYQSYP